MKQETMLNKTENLMRNVSIEKVVISCSATGADLEKSKKLLEYLTGMKAQIIKSKKRIPGFNVHPGLEVGTRITLRREKAIQLLKQFLASVNNTLYILQLSPNHFSFGIKEYIEIPGVEYKREIGIRGINVTVVFSRPGLRVKRKKIKSGNIPKKQDVTIEEITKFMEDNFQTKFI